MENVSFFTPMGCSHHQLYPASDYCSGVLYCGDGLSISRWWNLFFLERGIAYATRWWLAQAGESWCDTHYTLPWLTKTHRLSNILVSAFVTESMVCILYLLGPCIFQHCNLTMFHVAIVAPQASMSCCSLAFPLIVAVTMMASWPTLYKLSRAVWGLMPPDQTNTAAALYKALRVWHIES